jgi:hypothetical protein
MRQFLFYHPASVLIPVQNTDSGSFLQKTRSRRSADSARPAGDQYRFAVQSSHQIILRLLEDRMIEGMMQWFSGKPEGRRLAIDDRRMRIQDLIICYLRRDLSGYNDVDETGAFAAI